MNCIDTDQKALASLKKLCKVFIQETNKPLNSQVVHIVALIPKQAPAELEKDAKPRSLLE